MAKNPTNLAELLSNYRDLIRKKIQELESDAEIYGALAAIALVVNNTSLDVAYDLGLKPTAPRDLLNAYSALVLHNFLAELANDKPVKEAALAAINTAQEMIDAVGTTVGIVDQITAINTETTTETIVQ